MPQKDDIQFALPEGSKVKGGEREYRIVRVLGQGGYGITYLATAGVRVGQITSRATFALKEFFYKGRCHRAAGGLTMEYSAEAAADVEASLDSFRKEVLRLHHVCKLNRHIVDVNEVFDANGTAYYVMEYLDGGDLRSIVRQSARGGMDEQRTLSVMRHGRRAVCLYLF